MKNRTTAGLLAFFLGGIGVHRFYLGQTGLGFLYLIFCFTFIPAILALIDSISFFLMSDHAFDIKYNHKVAHGVVASQNMSNQINISNGNESDLDKLEKLARLRDTGVISEEEFQDKKFALMS